MDGRKRLGDGGLYKGYRGNDHEWGFGVKKYDSTVPVKIDRSIAALLDGFVKDSAAEGVQVIFVKSPVYRPLLDRFTARLCEDLRAIVHPD